MIRLPDAFSISEIIQLFAGLGEVSQDTPFIARFLILLSRTKRVVWRSIYCGFDTPAHGVASDF